LKENSLAKRYAAGLIKTLKDEKEYRDVKVELEQFLGLLNNIPDFKAGMETLLFSKNQKKDVLDSINKKVKFKDKTYKFLLTVLDENRLLYLDAMIQVLEELWFEKSGIEKLKVFSAVPLSSKLEKKLVQNLEKAFDKSIVLEKEIDESLIAGIKIQRGLVYYDFSIEGNLKKLKQALLTEDFTAVDPGKEASAGEH
jgi:F-type H+-transporting ATPase subunit delta